MTEVLVAKSLSALAATGLKRLVVAGGVGANRRLRQRLDVEAGWAGAEVFYPEFRLCTDNGAMIAFCGAQRLLSGATADASGAFAVRPRWPLSEC